MSRDSRLFILFTLIMTFLFVGTALSQVKRVAVFDFDDKADQGYSWWHGKGVGYGMADMLVTALVKSGKFKVYERAAMEKIMQEQQLGLSGVTTQETAAKVGKVLGVQYAIFGSVTEFGYKAGGVGGRVKGIGLGVKKYEAVVAVDIRIVDTETGEVLFSDTVRKQKSKSGLSVDTPNLDFRNENDFDDSLVGKATREAIEDIVKLMDENIKEGELTAKIIKIDEQGNIVINKGSAAGVQVGDVLAVFRQGEELIDPDTGLSLGSEMEEIGKIKVVADMLGGKAAKAEVISGSGLQNGDVVKRK